VRGLSARDRIKFTMKSLNPATDECKYFSADAPDGWSKDGVDKATYDALMRTITCETEHLTSFAIFPPSSSADESSHDNAVSVAVPAALGLFAVVVIAVIAFVVYRRRTAASGTGQSAKSSEPAKESSATEPTAV
jgi:hypothetical protein